MLLLRSCPENQCFPYSNWEPRSKILVPNFEKGEVLTTSKPSPGHPGILWPQFQCFPSCLSPRQLTKWHHRGLERKGLQLVSMHTTPTFNVIKQADNSEATSTSALLFTHPPGTPQKSVYCLVRETMKTSGSCFILASYPKTQVFKKESRTRLQTHQSDPSIRLEQQSVDQST